MASNEPVFIIGTPRSGSTALAEYLSELYDIPLWRGKESHFLAAPALARATGGPDGARFDRLRAKSIEEFYAGVPHAGAFVEGATSTLYYSEAARSVLDAHFPNAKLIAVLRDPVDRAISAHSYMTARGLERLGLQEALDAETDRVAQGWSHIWHYARHGNYGSQIEALGPWAERTLFLLHERDLGSADLVEKLSAHLGRSPVQSRVRLRQRNAAKTNLPPWIARWAEGVRATTAVRSSPRQVRRFGRWALKLMERRSVGSTSAVGANERRGVAQWIKADFARIEGLTGLPVREWWQSVD